MIPLQIQIKNFLSYGAHPPCISFEPYTLLCLSGKNGHGKSALLDALTWAIWGQARKIQGSARGDEYLIRLGQTHMAVTVEVVCDDIHYRIHRECTMVRGRATIELNFGIYDPVTKTIQSLTESHIRTTQQRICDLIGLTYETFINSVYLRQGQSNEFSKKTPRERKELLVTMLGLQRYEALYDAALERARTAQQEADRLSTLRDHLDQQGGQAELLTQRLEELTQQIALTQTQRTILSEQLHQLNQAEAHGAAELRVLQEHAATYPQLHQRSTQAQNAYRLAYTRWRTDRATLSRTTRLTSNTVEQQRQELEERLKLCKAAREQYQVVEEELRRSQHHLVTLRLKEEQRIQLALNAQHTVLRQAEQEIEHQSKEERRLQQACHEYKAATTRLGEKVEAARRAEEAYRAHATLFERRKSLYQRIKARCTSTTALREAAHLTLESLEREGVCPTCVQPLTGFTTERARRSALQRSMRWDGRIARMEKWLKTLETVLREQHAFLTEHESVVTQMPVLLHEYERTIVLHQHEEARLKTAAGHVAQLRERIPPFHATLTALQQELTQVAHHPLIHQEHLKVNTLEKERAHLLTLFAQEDALRKQYEQLPYSSAHHQRALLQEERERIKERGQLYREIRQAFEQAYAAQQRLPALLQEQRIRQEQLRALEHQCTALETHYQHQVSQRSQLETHLTLAEEQREESSRLSTLIASYTTAIEEYHALAQVVGKEGIQALLIEEALPELEDEANSLLARITDNQSHIRFESVKDLKSGKSKETLDIIISDSAGTRSYDLFSGGEAFRIDFALRIALSKLLTRRAGTALQTLIIDEGFGSQDEQGVEALLDALVKIQDEFAKVLVVSHLPSMKDHIPTHILVEKTPLGSIARIHDYTLETGL